MLQQRVLCDQHTVSHANLGGEGDCVDDGDFCGKVIAAL
jgi:hypothetical protein